VAYKLPPATDVRAEASTCAHESGSSATSANREAATYPSLMPEAAISSTRAASATSTSWWAGASAASAGRSGP